MREKIINIVLACILGVLIAGIIVKEVQYRRAERCDWTFAVKAGKNQIIQCCYYTGWYGMRNNDDVIGRVLCDTDETLNGSNCSKENSLIPDTFYCKWFSYNENKFYEINVALDRSKIKHFLKSSQYNRFLYLTAEFKEKGNVTIWLLSAVDTIELLSTRGQEVQEDWNEFKPDSSKISRNEYVNLVINKYQWNIVVNMKNKQFLNGVEVNTFNDEQYSFAKLDSAILYKMSGYGSLPLDSMAGFSLKSVPSEMWIWVSVDSSHDYSSWIDFDDSKIADFFLRKADKTKKSTFVVNVQITGDDAQADIWLKQGQLEVKVDSVTINSY